MKTKFLILIAFVAVQSLSPLSAQSSDMFTISGTVTDARQQKPVDYVNVVLLRASDSLFVKGTTADKKGYFVLSKIPSGNYLLRCFSYEYQVLFLSVTVNDNVRLDSIFMHPVSSELKEVVVQGEKPLYAVEGEKNIYNVSEDPGVQTGFASDALQNAPGVEVDIEGNITLRGVSGVDVWINDKPSHLTEENLKNYIQQLPANALDRIEVITNPSARYGSKGDGGIINIITKQKILKNQFFSFGVTGRSSPSASSWLSYVWANDKLSINAFGNFGWRRNITDANSYALAFEDEAQTDTITDRRDTQKIQKNTLYPYLYFNLDYQIDTSNSFSCWLHGSGSFSRSQDRNERYRKEYQLNGESYDYEINTLDTARNFWMSVGTNFEHKFREKGHQIQASLSGHFHDSPSRDYQSRIYTMGPLPDKFLRGKSKISSYDIAGDVDYVLPYSDKGSIELGAMMDYTGEKAGKHRDTLQDLFWTNDLLRSFDLHTSQWNVDMYGTWQHTWGGFTLKTGVRGGCTVIRGQYRTRPQYDDTITYWKLLPSLHLSYRTKNMHNFSLSYVMRKNEPFFDRLTSYKEYDEESFSTGNPELLPALTHSFDGGWTKYIRKFGSIGISGYFRLTTDNINSVADVAYDEVFGRVVNFSKPFNVSTVRNGGVELRVVCRPMKFMNIRFYANLYDSYLHTQYEHFGELRNVEQEMFSYSFRLNFWAKFWKRLEIYASARYSSPTQGLYSKREARYSISGGLRCDFFKRKLSVSLRVHDILNSNKSENRTTNPYYESYSYSHNSSRGRSFSVGITLRFGKMELEKLSKEVGERGDSHDNGENGD